MSKEARTFVQAWWEVIPGGVNPLSFLACSAHGYDDQEKRKKNSPKEESGKCRHESNNIHPSPWSNSKRQKTPVRLELLHSPESALSGST